MSNFSAKRIMTLTGLIAGGAVLSCPALAAGAGIVAAATVVTSVTGSMLANDLHSAITAHRLNPLANHHLTQLVGRSLATLIELFEANHNPRSYAGNWIPFLHRKDAELSALAKAARERWEKVELPEGHAITDAQVHKAFESEKGRNPILISAEEWDTHLQTLAIYARTTFGDEIYIDSDKRKPLAAFIAEHFTRAVRELVKADLDPSIGTGGRVFIALHLDLMRSMAVSIRKVDSANQEILSVQKSLADQFAGLSQLILQSLTREQKANPDCFDLVHAFKQEQQALSEQIANGFAQVKAKQEEHSRDHAEQKEQFDRIEKQKEQLDRIEKIVLAKKQSNSETQAQLSDADRAILEQAKEHGDLKTRVAASVLVPDSQTDKLLAELRAKHQADEFDLCMLEGKRWHFDKHQLSDQAIPFFELAMELRPDSFDARIYAALAHNTARLGDIEAHQKRAIDVFDGTLSRVPAGSVDWAMTQNNLGNAWQIMPTGDRGENLQRAIKAYKAALTVYTKVAHPVDWAMTQNNLAVALAAIAELDGQDRCGLLRRAIAAGKGALTIRTAKAMPHDHASTSRNLQIDREAYEAAGCGSAIPFDDIEPAQ